MKRKRRLGLIALIMLMIAAFSVPTYAAKKPSKAKVHAAYQKHLKKLANTTYDMNLSHGYQFVDLNRDGVDEMISFVMALRPRVTICTYRGGKVRTVFDRGCTGGLSYNKKGKVYIYECSGVGWYDDTIYTFDGKKLIRKRRTASRGPYAGGKMKYYINGKRTSYKKFRAEEKKIGKIVSKWQSFSFTPREF